MDDLFEVIVALGYKLFTNSDIPWARIASVVAPVVVLLPLALLALGWLYNNTPTNPTDATRDRISDTTRDSIRARTRIMDADGRLAVLAIVAALAGKQNGDDTFALPLLVHVHLTLHGRCNGGGGHSLASPVGWCWLFGAWLFGACSLVCARAHTAMLTRTREVPRSADTMTYGTDIWPNCRYLADYGVAYHRARTRRGLLQRSESAPRTTHHDHTPDCTHHGRTTHQIMAIAHTMATHDGHRGRTKLYGYP